MIAEEKRAHGETCHFCKAIKGSVIEFQSDSGGLVARICRPCLIELNRKVEGLK